MARIGGRSLWLAWPVGLVCAGVVGALVWTAMPAVPGTITWIGDTLRSATSAPVAQPPAPVQTQALDADTPVDCRALYPDALWSGLVWDKNVMLDQDLSRPATALTGLVDALQPVVRVTCSWSSPTGTIVTTLARVAPDAATVADATLRGEGFTCAAFGSGITCHRTAGDVVEEQSVREGLWLVSVETAWFPEDYGVQLAGRVWG